RQQEPGDRLRAGLHLPDHHQHAVRPAVGRRRPPRPLLAPRLLALAAPAPPADAGRGPRDAHRPQDQRRPRGDRGDHRRLLLPSGRARDRPPHRRVPPAPGHRAAPQRAAPLVARRPTPLLGLRPPRPARAAAAAGPARLIPPTPTPTPTPQGDPTTMRIPRASIALLGALTV